jgi:NAD(P)-dependent dehydrogenase (short-subunit alcohol dehydrogenase family)
MTDREVVLVTGASRGIGRAVAVAFADRGARVAVHYGSSRGAADETLRSLAGDGHLIVEADVANPDDVRRMVDEVLAAAGRIDVLVNNAGIYVEHRIADVGYAEWQRAWRDTVDVNLMGSANTTYCVARHMIERGGGGRIVNVTSRGAVRGEPDHPAYGASKAALNSFGQSMAKALGEYGISVTTVAPAFTATDMAAPFLDGPDGEAILAQSPLRRAARPEEIAAAVVYLASPEAEFATGAILDLNGASYFRQ